MSQEERKKHLLSPLRHLGGLEPALGSILAPEVIDALQPIEAQPSPGPFFCREAHSVLLPCSGCASRASPPAWDNVPGSSASPPGSEPQHPEKPSLGAFLPCSIFPGASPPAQELFPQLSNFSQFGGSFLRCNNPELACLFPAANLRQKFPPFSRRRGGGRGISVIQAGVGATILDPSFLPPNCSFECDKLQNT